MATGILIGAFVAVALEGVGRALRGRVGGGVVGALDGIGGAILLAALALLVAWGFGAVALHASGNNARKFREAVQQSAILGALNDALPPSGPLLNVLRRVDPTPSIRGPDADVPPPDAGLTDDPEIQAAGESTLRVLGTACGLGVAGSGWVAGPGTVVTNAHVVAGEDDTTVMTAGGPSSTRPRSATSPATTSPCSRSRGWRHRRSGSPPTAAGLGGGGDRISGERAPDLHASASRTHRPGHQPGLLRARARRASR